MEEKLETSTEPEPDQPVKPTQSKSDDEAVMTKPKSRPSSAKHFRRTTINGMVIIEPVEALLKKSDFDK